MFRQFLHHINSIFVPSNHVTNSLLPSRMSGGTRGAARRGQGHGHGNVPEYDSNLPPPLSMVQLMAMYETNRADNMRLLEMIERNTAQRQDTGINDFIRLNPPVFSFSSEPLDADY